MHVEEIRYAELLHRLNHCAAVQAEALPIVAIFAALHAVQPFAIEQLRAVEEIEAHAIANAAIQHGHEAVVAMEWNRDAGNRDPTIRHVLLHLAVVGQVHRHLMSLARHSRGNAPTTSASPPVFANGTHSEAAYAICIPAPPLYDAARYANTMASRCFKLEVILSALSASTTNAEETQARSELPSRCRCLPTRRGRARQHCTGFGPRDRSGTWRDHAPARPGRRAPVADRV